MDSIRPDYELIRHLVPPAILGESLDIALLGSIAALDAQKSLLEEQLQVLAPNQRGDVVQLLLAVNRARKELMEVLQLIHPEAGQN